MKAGQPSDAPSSNRFFHSVQIVQNGDMVHEHVRCIIHREAFKGKNVIRKDTHCGPEIMRILQRQKKGKANGSSPSELHPTMWPNSQRFRGGHRKSPAAFCPLSFIRGPVSSATSSCSFITATTCSFSSRWHKTQQKELETENCCKSWCGK